MAKIIRFTTPEMQERESLMAEIRRLAAACNWDWEKLTANACGEGKTWEDRPVDFLYGPLNILREHLVELEEKAAATAKVRRAKIISFNTGEVLPPTVSPVETPSGVVLTREDGTLWVQHENGVLFGPMHRMVDDSLWYHTGNNIFSVGEIDPSGNFHTRQVKARACRDGSPHAQDFKVELQRQGKLKAASASKQPRQAPAQPEGTARLVRKVKMIQRDCEKALPEFSDYTYRAILDELYGAASSKDLDNLQLLNLIMYLQGLLRGQSASRENGKAIVDAPALLYSDASGLNRCGSMRKIQALLAEKGKAEGKYIRWAYALGILKRQTKGVVTDWENSTPRQLDAVIAALSRDAERKGRRTL